MEVPLSDLFVWGTPAAPLDKIESAMNAGQDFIGDDLCDHYAFRQGIVDWQIWITAGAKPLPRKIVVTSRADDARPQSVSLLSWNLKPTFTDAVFRFTPPAGAKAIEILPQEDPLEEREHEHFDQQRNQDLLGGSRPGGPRGCADG